MGLTNTFENAIINHFLRNTSQTPAATIYVGALTAVTNEETGSVTEVSTTSTGYVRKAITIGAPTAGVATNSAQVDFDVATGSWGTVTYLGLYDASSSGNLLAVSAALSPSQTITTGQQLSISAGAATFTFD